MRHTERNCLSQEHNNDPGQFLKPDLSNRFTSYSAIWSNHAFHEIIYKIRSLCNFHLLPCTGIQNKQTNKQTWKNRKKAKHKIPTPVLEETDWRAVILIVALPRLHSFLFFRFQRDHSCNTERQLRMPAKSITKLYRRNATLFKFQHHVLTCWSFQWSTHHHGSWFLPKMIRHHRLPELIKRSRINEWM